MPGQASGVALIDLASSLMARAFSISPFPSLKYCGGEIGATQHVVWSRAPGQIFLRSGTWGLPFSNNVCT
jgi:hypothetical protein